MNIQITGKKIILRKLKISDAESIYRNANNRDISRYSDILYPYSLNEIKKFIRKTKRKIKNTSGYHLGIELTNQKGIIGIIALNHIDNKHKKAEIEYWLGKKYWKQGIAKESVKMILDFGFKKLKLNRIYAKAIPQNTTSWKLLEKCGFSHEGKLRESFFEKRRFIDLLVYSILKREFNK